MIISSSTALARLSSPLSVDQLDEADSMTYRLRVPGYRRRDLTVEVRDRLVIARGERTIGWFKPRTKKSFFQAIELPDALDERDVQATLARGVLRLTIAKKPHARRRQIPIHTPSAAPASHAQSARSRSRIMEWFGQVAENVALSMRQLFGTDRATS